MRNWDELNLRKDIISALKQCGYFFPTEIQSKSIKLILQGNDLVGGSATGSGKTLAFGLPAIEKIDFDVKGVEVLIICPTRELAIQVCDEIKKVATIVDKQIKVVPIYGGADFQRQVGQLVKGAKIVVGTPGRVLDHLERKSLKLKNCSMLILDEADEMLSMGFRPDIEKVIAKFKAKPQMLLFSATMPNDILMLIDKYLQEPKYVMIENANKPSENVKQFYLLVDKKIDALIYIVKKIGKERSLIFCNTKAMTENISKHLKALGYKCDMLNGDMNQQIRKKVLDNFRSNHLQFLICTDVASRGLDIDSLPYVINYDLPKINDWYIHRIGRTGRKNNTGVAYTILNRKEQLEQLKEFAKQNKFVLNEIKLNVNEINVKKQKSKLAPDIKTTAKNVEKRKTNIAKNVRKNTSKNSGKSTFNNNKEKISKNLKYKDKEKRFIQNYDYDGLSEEEFNSLFNNSKNKRK